MTSFFDPQQNTHFEVAEYFSCKDVSALVLAGVSHLQTAVGLIGSPWYKGRKEAVRTSLRGWHMTEPFCNVVRVWAMWEDLDHDSLGIVGTMIGLLEKLTEEDEIPLELGWSTANSNSTRGRENSTQLLALVEQLHQQHRIECCDESMRQLAVDCGLVIDNLELRPAMSQSSVEFLELKRVVDQLAKQVPAASQRQ